MSGWVHKFRLQLKIPQPIVPSPVCVPSEIENYLLLSLETSDILLNATSSGFSEEISVAAFERDLRKYSEQYGRNNAQLMQCRLVLLNMGPTNFLTHIYNIINLPKIHSSIKVETGLQPFLFRWVRVMIYYGPKVKTAEDTDDDEECQ